jgi:hypothetical protein
VLVVLHAKRQLRDATLGTFHGRGALEPFDKLEVTSFGMVPDVNAYLWKPSQTSRDLPGINVAHIKACKQALTRAREAGITATKA